METLTVKAPDAVLALIALAQAYPGIVVVSLISTVGGAFLATVRFAFGRKR